MMSRDVGLLLLRGVAGGMMLLSHGLPKLLAYGEKAERFSDPLGVGSPVSLALAIFAELGCSLLVILGLGTRLASVPLVFTMAVAAFVVHGDDPFSKKELALLYGSTFSALLLLGAGRLSLDHVLAPRLPATLRRFLR